MSAARALFAAQIYVVWHTVKGPAGHSFHENGLPLENEWDRLAGPCEDFYEEVVIGDPRKQHIEFVKTLEGLPPGATLAQVEALSIDNLKARAADFIGRLTDQEAKTQREAEYKELPDYRVDNDDLFSWKPALAGRLCSEARSSTLRHKQQRSRWRTQNERTARHALVVPLQLALSLRSDRRATSHKRPI